VGIRQELLVVGERDERRASEAALVRAAQAGDRGALEQLVALYKQPLFVLCYGILGHVQDAEDAVQETYLRVLRTLPDFRGDASFRTWLCRVAVNLCLDWKRAATRSVEIRTTEPWDEENPGNSIPTRSPEAIALDRLQVLEALRSLPPRHRALLLLKEREGWSLVEIAAALRWSPIRVKNELAKARRALVEWRREVGEGEAR
jgi:RNA polymerase sigma-70 factor (ECF subfamily)